MAAASVLGLSDDAAAQLWTDWFNHPDGITNTAGATDPRAGFTTVTWAPGLAQFPTNLKAVHMSLIPKGPYQGRVLVWDHEQIVVGTPPPGLTSPSGQYTYQPFAIVDPSPGASQRFLNFLLPIGPAIYNAATGLWEGGDLFCSGHCWTQFGDLVVVGGTNYVFPLPNVQILAADTIFLFNPTLNSEHYVPGPNSSVTVAMSGRWMHDPNFKLQEPRWYPSAVLTSKVQRLGFQHAIGIVGGQKDLTRQTGGTNPTFNSYEAVRITAASSLTPGTPPVAFLGLATDTFNLANPPYLVPGPSVAFPQNVLLDSFYFYPRTHLLTSGKMFMSSFVPVSATGDHEMASWAQGPGAALPLGNWNSLRQYGASVHYPNLGGYQNWIVRLGGYDPAHTPNTVTNSVEIINAADPAAQWVPTHPMKYTRTECNVVILPDASLVVFGGEGAVSPGTAVVPILEPEIFKAGSSGWSLLPAATSVRDYHSTALLLPDGRVLVAGGDSFGLGWAYEVFSPDYRVSPQGLPQVHPVVTALSGTYDSVNRAYQVVHGQTITASLNPLPLGASIERAVFMAPGSTTHHSDMHQRYYQVKAVHQSPTQVAFVAPPSNDHLPAGYYMVFLVSSTGLPSIAQWVRIQ
jgi:hypothetical protein